MERAAPRRARPRRVRLRGLARGALTAEPGSVRLRAPRRTDVPTRHAATLSKMLSAVLLCLCAWACGAAARADGGNFLDDKWLGGRWDKFRDEPGTWNPGKPFDEALDPAKDPCQKIKCGRHKVCVAEDSRTPSCMSQRRVSFKDISLAQTPSSKCKRCPVVHPSPVCGTDGHSYSSKCKLEYQACISEKQIAVKCVGQCPCPSVISHSRVEKKGCSNAELTEVVSRLRDWFKVLHENGSHKKVPFQRGERSRMSSAPLCKDSLGWMFTRLDTNFDLSLDQSELASLAQDKNDRCTTVFFRSCDTSGDKRISEREWCFCFQRQKESPCHTELNNIKNKEAGKRLLGQYVPACDDDGFYNSQQCHGSSGQCWCVDRYGNELAGSRTHGAANCGVVVESSGDFGSGDVHVSDGEDADYLNDEEELGDDEDEGDDEDDGYLS
ncbi:testican-3 isoform X2 [Denticeps clupeoides]|uniref:Testican-3 n=1 Tax=Denticeps clupeoides TaxID=299321 RepID=A0AAY4B7S3_9TELE|nr:testican-3-like isoform X2 [Denticeps clupeoides]